MIEFKPVYEAKLPELPGNWNWLRGTDGDWCVDNLNRSTIRISRYGDIGPVCDYYYIPLKVIKALYAANGVEL